MKLKYTFCILFSLLLLFSCGKSDQPYTIETKDGVKYIHNHAPLWYDEPKVALEFVQKIGELEGEDENYLFYEPFEVVRDSEGNIFVVDGGNRRVQKFNADGQYIFTIGREGQGPGEFSDAIVRNSYSINIDSESNIYVNDSGNTRIHVFSSDGKYLRGIRLGKLISFFRLQKSGKLVAQNFFEFSRRINKGEIPKLLEIYNAKGELLKGFGKIKEFKDETISMRGNDIFFDVDAEDNIYISFWRQNRIDKYSPDGILLLTIDRSLNYELSHKKRILTYPSPIDPAKTMEMPIIDFTSVSTKGLGIDYKGRLWVPTYRRQKKKDEDTKTATDLIVLEIYDGDGVLLCRLPNDFYFNRFRVFRDRVYFIDASYEMCVYEYKIVEK